MTKKYRLFKGLRISFIIKLSNYRDNRGVLENLKDYPMDIFSMYRDGHMDEEPLLK